MFKRKAIKSDKRIEGTCIDIDMESVHEMFIERINRTVRDVDAPTIPSSDVHIDHVKLWTENECRKWLPCLKLDETSRVLEMGFGTGRMTKYLTPLCGHYTGIECVDEFVKIAQARTDIHLDNAVLLKGYFHDLATHRLKLPCQTYNRFVIAAGVFTYINDEEAREDIKALVPLLSEQEDCIIYISEPIAVENRLTLNKFYSEEMKQEYSAIYRTENQYLKLFIPLLEAGFIIKVSEEFFEKDIKGRKETRQWVFILERRGANS